jgi:leucyl-tRNA synthetase
MYLGPLDASKPWNTRDIVGVNRFLRRVWRNFVDEESDELLVTDNDAPEELLRSLHKTIERVTHDMERMSFNTAIAALIEFTSELVALDRIPREVARTFVLLLAPLAPHMAEELWSRMGHADTLAYEPWPVADPALLKDSTIDLAVQVNGKLRATISVDANASQEAILSVAKQDPNVARHVEGKTMRREIYVPGRLVNLVVS